MIDVEKAIERIPNDGFMRVRLVNDFYNLSVDSSRDGEPSKIVVTRLDGLEKEIGSGELSKRFEYVDGNQIKMYTIRRGKKQLVKSKGHIDLAALFIPGRLVGKSVDNYILFGYSGEGEVERSEYRLIDAKTFRKSCQILMAPKKILLYGEDLRETGMEDIIASKDMDLDIVEEPKEKELAQFRNSFNMGSLKEENIGKHELESSNKVRKLEAIYTKRDPVKNNKVILFGVTDGIKTVEMTSVQLMYFAKKGMVTNIGVGVRNGKPYVHGVGMLIADLPIETTM